ncbi:MAG TPA: YceI family protein [Acetobacteraceae bacterium]|nr:YceI family protein [Acetobacteraceae bacterium]
MIRSLSPCPRRAFGPPGWRRYAGLAIGLLLGLVAGAVPASAGPLDYLISQHYGTIGFSVSQLGIFSVDGRFTRFAGRLAIDQQHPTETRIDVTIEAGSAAMASSDAVSMLRSPAYFDVAQYPAIHFVSKSISQVASGSFVIHGDLTIRGITHPQALEATLVNEQDPPSGPTIADFRVTGNLLRSAYGMMANQNFVGNKVHLAIFIRLTLDSPAHGS